MAVVLPQVVVDAVDVFLEFVWSAESFSANIANKLRGALVNNPKVTLKLFQSFIWSLSVVWDQTFHLKYFNQKRY